MKILHIALLVTLAASSTGCANLRQDPRDAAWDPKGSQQLFDQIPNWEGGANKVCCGHLRRCQPHQTPRC
jgi:hypothetical protein